MLLEGIVMIINFVFVILISPIRGRGCCDPRLVAVARDGLRSQPISYGVRERVSPLVSFA